MVMPPVTAAFLYKDVMNNAVMSGIIGAGLFCTRIGIVY